MWEALGGGPGVSMLKKVCQANAAVRGLVAWSENVLKRRVLK